MGFSLLCLFSVNTEVLYEDMLLSNDFVMRKWKPFRWGIIVGVLFTLGFLFFTFAENDTIPWGLFSWYTLMLFVAITLSSVIAFYVYTIFQNWIAPPYEKDDSWKKP